MPTNSQSVRRAVQRLPARMLSRLVLLSLAALAPASELAAQSAPTDPREALPECLRFTFGKWTPTLDWSGAGHAVRLDTNKVDRAPDGRAWAGTAPIASGDTVMVLYPAFWPAGVALSFDARTLSPTDTVTAQATAFVANAAVKSPVATARVWRVKCR